jgi:hypothetical protein
MTDDPLQTIVDRLEKEGFDPRPSGSGWESRCPGHNGDRRNLTISEGDDGRALIHCHAHNCQPAAILTPLELTMSDLFMSDSAEATNPGNGVTRPGSKHDRLAYPTPEWALSRPIRDYGPPTEFGVYHEEDGSESFRVYRFDFRDARTGEPAKSYRPVHRTAEGWVVGDPPGQLPLYRLPEVTGAAVVYCFEGEKCADLGRRLGLTTTTTAHGAQSPHKSDLAPLAGKDLVLIPDADQAGEGYVAKLIPLLARLTPRPRVKIVRLPGLAFGQDIEEWLVRFDSKEEAAAELRRLVEATAEETLGPVTEATVAPVSVVSPSPTPAPWPPLRLEELPASPAFPVDAFPPTLQTFCREVAEAVQAPVEFVGAAMLAVAGAAIGQSVNLSLSRTWAEPPLLYLILVGRPGTAKSPTIKTVVRPLSLIDRRLRQESAKAREAWLPKKKAHEKDPDNAPPPGPEPPQLRAVVKDVTRETLAIILTDNPRGVLDDPDEASGWVAAFNEYKSGGADRQFWLSVWSCAAVSVDRKSGRESYHVPHPFIAVLAGVQPSMLGSLAEERGRDDGFIDRLLFAFPDAAAFPRQRWTRSELSPEAERDWAGAIERLHAMQMVQDPETKSTRPFYVKFTDEAERAWAGWFDGHADESDAPDFPDDLAGAWSKMKGQTARFALILSRLALACDPTSDPHSGPVDADHVRGAVAISNYFKTQAQRVRHEMTGGAGSTDAKAVLDWVRRNRKQTFRESDVAADLRRFRTNPRALSDALRALSGLGAIRPANEPRRPGPGRTGSKTYEVHPDLIGAPDNPGNTANDVDPSDAPAIRGISGKSWQVQSGEEGGREVCEL